MATTAPTKAHALTLQERYNLALMLGLAQKFGHQPEAVGPGRWRVKSRSEDGYRIVTKQGNRLHCDCPAGRLCTHRAAVHLLLCKQQGVQPLARPCPPEMMQLDPSPEARHALALIQRPRPPQPLTTEELTPAEAEPPVLPGPATRHPTRPLPFNPANPACPAEEAERREAAKRRDAAPLLRDMGDFSIFKH